METYGVGWRWSVECMETYGVGWRWSVVDGMVDWRWMGLGGGGRCRAWVEVEVEGGGGWLTLHTRCRHSQSSKCTKFRLADSWLTVG